jgi:hypothetical protein
MTSVDESATQGTDSLAFIDTEAAGAKTFTLSLQEALALRERYPRGSAWQLGSIGRLLAMADMHIEAVAASAVQRHAAWEVR